MQYVNCRRQLRLDHSVRLRNAEVHKRQQPHKQHFQHLNCYLQPTASLLLGPTLGPARPWTARQTRSILH
jgi:hypothetical protein